MTSTPRVNVTIDGAIAHVELARPAKRNGLDQAMFEAIVEAGEQLQTDTRVRAVVLSGQGAAFCAGLDWKSFMANPASSEVLLARGSESPANLAQRVAWIWQELPVPVIAAVHGVALGGGLQIALGADIRFVTADARLSVMEIHYGLIPDMGISQTLLGLVSNDVARELVFTGRELTGEEAVSLGLATRVVDDPVQAARSAAATIANRSPHAVRAAKRLLQRAPALTVSESLALETELQRPLLGSKNQLEAVMAKMSKRAPVFDDPE